MKARLLAALALATTFGIGAVEAASPPHRVSYPQELLISQSGEYVAGFETLRLPGSDSGTYRLVVRKKYEDRDLAKYEFHRSADAQWSEYSDSLFVTDFAGSNVSDCLVLADPVHDRKFTSLSASLPSKGFPGWDSRDLTALHAYLTCDRWLDRTHLRAEFRGYDSGRSFDHHLIYDTATKALHTE